MDYFWRNNGSVIQKFRIVFLGSEFFGLEYRLKPELL